MRLSRGKAWQIDGSIVMLWMSHWGEEGVDTSSSKARAATDKNNQQPGVKGKRRRVTKRDILRNTQRTGHIGFDFCLALAAAQHIAPHEFDTTVNSSWFCQDLKLRTDGRFSPWEGTVLLIPCVFLIKSGTSLIYQSYALCFRFTKTAWAVHSLQGDFGDNIF